MIMLDLYCRHRHLPAPLELLRAATGISGWFHAHLATSVSMTSIFAVQESSACLADYGYCLAEFKHWGRLFRGVYLTTASGTSRPSNQLPYWLANIIFDLISPTRQLSLPLKIIVQGDLFWLGVGNVLTRRFWRCWHYWGKGVDCVYLTSVAVVQIIMRIYINSTSV